MIKLDLISKYVSSFNTFIFFILTFEFVEVLTVLISLFVFGLRYYNHEVIPKCRYHFKQLPLFNKMLAIWFTIFYAIPNKIFVNNNQSNFSVTLSIFLLIMISNVFSQFILLYIIFWVNVLESYFFAVCYESHVSFRKLINNQLFKGDEVFSKEYFNFFWGNMDSGGAGKARSGLLGTFFGGLYNVARNQEKTHVRVQGQIEAQIHIKEAAQKPKTPAEVLAVRKEAEAHVIERDTVILKAENQVKNLAQQALDWANNS